MEFTRHYYGANALDILPWFDFFKKAMVAGSYQSFMDKHFPQEWMNQLADSNLVMSFEPTQPVKLLDSDKFADWFLVKGMMTTHNVVNGRSELVSQIPVAAKIVMEHRAGSGDKVATLIELHPGDAGFSSSSHAGSMGSPQASSNGANSPSELAQPNRGSQLGASTQGDLITHAADGVADAAKKLGL